MTPEPRVEDLSEDIVDEEFDEILESEYEYQDDDLHEEDE